MAFNLDQKPYSEFSLNTPVYSKPLEEGILGEAQMNGTILVSDKMENIDQINNTCLLYTSPSPRDEKVSRMPSSA